MKSKLIKILFVFICTLIALCILPTSLSGRDFTVVIDAGHGGHDPGAIGKISKEKNINLNVALQLGKMIGKNCNDVKVIYTRKTDVFIPLNRRAEIANDAKADLFISIHTNAVAKGKIVRGAETFTLGLARSESNLEIAKRENSVILIEDDYKQRYAGFNPNSSESYIMFEFIQDKHMEQSVQLAKLVQKQFKSHAQRIDRGVHQAGFLVLRATTMPSILVELGYISTADEEKYLNSQEGIETLGNSIYKAFINYKNEHQKLLNNDNSIDLAKSTEPKKNKNIIINKDSNKNNSYLETKPDIKTVETLVINDQTVFKIQILTSNKLLKKNDSQFKGLNPVDYYKENGVYKYTYLESNDYDKIYKARKEILSKFKDSFIIASKNGKRVNIKEAINEFKRNKLK